MAVCWCYVVESVDRSGVFARETFIHPESARSRYDNLRRAGFYKVSIRQRRVGSYGQTLAMRPGIGKRA